jgi:signal transduction histidine kinase/CheY-like chemotaxis protein
MTASPTPRKSGSVQSPHTDLAEASAHLDRMTWTMRIVLLGLGLSLWVAHAGLAGRRKLDAHDREVGERATAVELAASRLEQAADGKRDGASSTVSRSAAERRLRLALDSLGMAVVSYSADHFAAARNAGVDSLVNEWDISRSQQLDPAGLDSVTQRLEALRRDENADHLGRGASYSIVLLISSVVFAVGAAALAVIVFQMRRRLANQLAHALEAHNIILAQKESLTQKHAKLEAQTTELRAAAVDTDAQARALEVQTAELETTVEELRDSERRQRQLADESALLARRLAEAQRVAKIGYWELDPDTDVIFWSNEMYALADIDPSIVPPPSAEFIARIHPDDRQRLVDATEKAKTSSKEFTENYRLQTLRGTSGAWRSMQAHARVVTNEYGEAKLVGTVQDVTERVVLENQLRRSQKMEAVGQLAGGIAHDFNNILTVIDGYSSLLLADQPADSAHRADIEEIRNAAARAATLTRQLLAFSGRQVLQPQVLDLNATIGGIENMLRRLIGENIQVETRLQSGLDLIKADPGQLETVIVNLIVNARDAMDAGGILTIETRNVTLDPIDADGERQVTPAPFVMLSIADTGAGIAPEIVDRIYEPFFTTKVGGKGTGLGLSTVLGIVEQSGGQIRVSTEPGKGTMFKLYFPKTNAAAPSKVAKQTSDTPKPGSETILLVEDDTSVRNVASAALTRAGYTVIECTNGVAALVRCEDESLLIDIVVTDMVMPAMGGRELATRLLERRPDLPIVFMSGYTRDAMIHSAALRPSESFVEKPFTPGILTRKVREALDAAAKRRGVTQAPSDLSASGARS